MDVFIGLTVFIVIAIFSYSYYVKQYVNASMVKVPTGSVAWDGETVYPAGSVHLPFKYQLIDIEERITTFGVDVLGLVSVVDTFSDESGYATEEGHNDKGPFGKQTISGKSGNQIVTTRQSAEYKYRYIIVWKPNLDRIRQFVKSGNIPDRIAELLRTIPDLNMSAYADTLGITVVRWDTPKKKTVTDSVDLGDGVEIPY
ncbi:MAG TPA: hypothetical protein VE974_06250 [Thermoanaerobaculia bacterium]|nr:hypothetical protein [Thermoanaerobaculia bacterium]